MSLEYNTERNHLIISEYGRNIQRMVEHAVNIPEREDRNKAAKTIIGVMGQLNPHLRDINDFTHKLWDHLFIISDFQLDVDSPYPIPTRETFEEKPANMPYPKNDITYKHFGRVMDRMIEKAIEWEEGEEKEALIEMIANQMKKSYVNWNRDTVSDDVIFDKLEQMSGGKIKMDRSKPLVDVKPNIQNPRTNNKKKRKSKRSNHKRNHRN